MKDTESTHKKIQEMIDCYAVNDPLKEMSQINAESDPGEAAVKWIALAVLHGVNQNAKKISIRRAGDGSVRVTAKYREAELPSPGEAVGQRVIDLIRGVTHMEGEKGKVPFALGVRNDSLTLKAKVETEDGEQSLTLKFPG
ncbi:MAG: hypothetical protein K9K88_07200 [Desulfobacterales bacterium]|nr:hypothetical protein [Desulfobacterales bacterium]